MSSNYVLPLSSSQKSPRHVLTVDRELQNENKALSGQDGDVLAVPWKQVYSRAERDARKALLKSQFEKKHSSSRYEAKSFDEQRRPTLAQLAVSRQAKEAKELKSQQEIAAVMEQSAVVKQQSDALQDKVANLQSTLDKLLSVLEGKFAVSDPKPSVDTNDGSPVSKFELTESPTKASYKEALERSSPSTSQTSSAASSPSTRAGSSPSISTANSPIAGSPIATQQSTEPSSAPAKVVPATADKKITPTHLLGAKSPLPKVAISLPMLPTVSAVKKSTTTPPPTKSMSSPTSPTIRSRSPSSPSSHGSSSDSESTPDRKTSRKARRKARKMELKAEKVTKALAASYSLVKSVTDNFIKLGTDNYDPWRRKWEREIPSLSYNKDYLSIEGPELDLKAEKAHETTQRKNAAMMFLKTIDHSVHEEWLRDVDHQNPQAIIRRLHLKFRGSNTIAISSVIEAQLLLMTMKSTQLDVTAYGSAIIENLRKLREMNAPMCEVKMITLYLLGLNKLFDTIRFTIETLIAENKPTAPKTMAQAKKMVEDWAVKFKDRGLLIFKDMSGGDRKAVDVMLDVVTTSNEACRSWLRYGKCKGNEVGKCTFQHDIAKKSINAPSPAVLSSAAASNGKTKDFSTVMCTECNVKGHSSYWHKCPTKLERRSASAKNVMHLNSATHHPSNSLPPTAADGALPPTPSIQSVIEKMHGYNEKLLSIFNVLATNSRSNGAVSAGSPLLDPAAMLLAFQGNPFGL